MKTNILIETILAGAVAFAISSCTQTDDSKKTAEQLNKENFESRTQEKDAQFLVDVAEITLKEIELGRLAQTKSTDKEVKELGKKIEDEHTKSFNALKDLAEKKGITIPSVITDDIQQEYDKLSQKQESEFNKDYCGKIVKEHKDAIDKVEKIVAESQDEDIKDWATAALPVFVKSLDEANSCAESNGNGNSKFESGIGK